MTIHTLAISGAEFLDALTYQVTGMCVVFSCLILLCLILTASGAVAQRMEAKRKAAEAAAKAALAAAAPAPAPAPAPVAMTPVGPAPSAAEVAAIAAGIYDAAASSITPEVIAAIAAAIKVTVGNEARILDIKRVDTSYAENGRTSIMNSHLPARG